MVVLAFLWGGTFVVVKNALHDVSTMCFLALRFGVAAAAMLLLFAKAFRGMRRGELWCGFRGGLITGCFLWLGYALQTWGLERTSVANSGFLTGLYIVLVPLFSAALYRRWPAAAELAGIAFASAGIVSLTGSGLSLHFNAGDILTIGCAVAFAFHVIVLGYFSQRERFQAVATGQIAAVCMVSCTALAFEPPRIAWTRGVIFAVVLTGIFATALAFSLQTWAQKYTSASRTVLILSLEPVFAYAGAILFAGEHLSLHSAFGGSLILAGILVVELRRPAAA